MGPFPVRLIPFMYYLAIPRTASMEPEIAPHGTAWSSPHNKGINLTARGRHALCSVGRLSGSILRARRPCSQVIPVLYGRLKKWKIKMKIRRNNWRMWILIMSLGVVSISCKSTTTGENPETYNSYYGDSIAIQAIVKSNKFDSGFLRIITTDSSHQDFERIGKRVIAIYLDWAGIQVLPKEIRYLTELELFNLNGNSIETLPVEIGELKALQRLILGGNKLKNLPDEITKLSGLQLLTLPDNQISSLPKEFGDLRNLTKLYLINNELSDLPLSIVKIYGLKNGLRIEGNKICDPPSEIKSWIENFHDTIVDWSSEQRCE
jgi:hypothetical protein